MDVVFQTERRKERENEISDCGQRSVSPLKGRRHDEDKGALREVRAAHRGKKRLST